MDTNDKQTKSEGAPKGQNAGTPGPMAMGMEMAKKMMSQMGEGGSPMAMMQKMMGQMKASGDGKPPMEQMMGMCMGMCGEILSAINKTAAMATFATPELRDMFGEWLAKIETQAVESLKRGGAADVAQLAKSLNISEQGAAYVVTQMLKKGKVSLRVEAAKAP